MEAYLQLPSPGYASFKPAESESVGSVGERRSRQCFESPSLEQPHQCIVRFMFTKFFFLSPLPLGLLLSVSYVAAPKAPYPAAKHGGNYMFNYCLPPAPSTTPWAPAWSPDGKWIAVA